MTGMVRSNTVLSREDLKRIHQKQIFLLARGGDSPRADFPGISRAELTQQLGLTFPSVTALVDELLELGVLEETGELVISDRGRPRRLLRAVASLFCVPVFALREEGFHFCLYDAYGTVIRESLLPFPCGIASNTLWEPSLETFCAPFLSCLAPLAGKHRLCDIVLTLPGNISSGVFASSSLGVVSPPGFVQYLAEKAGLGVQIINSADSFAYAEQLYDPTISDYVYVHVSAGVGAGIIRQGQIFSCQPWRAGEVGHISIDYNGRPCRCGSRGCLERYLCRSALVEDAGQLLPDAPATFDAVCKAYQSGDPGINAFIDSRAELLCAALNNMFSLHPVTHVIIGGSITRLGDGFLACLRQKMAARVCRIYKGKFELTFSKRGGNDSTFGAYHNYVTNLLPMDSLL